MRGVDLKKMLHHRRGSAGPAFTCAVKYRLSGFSPVNGFGRGVGLLFVRVSRPPYSAGKFRAAALLNHVRRFMRRELQAGLFLERDTIARRVSERTHALVGLSGGSADTGFCTAQIMSPEGGLNPVRMGKFLVCARYPFARGAVDAGGFAIVPARAPSAAGAFGLNSYGWLLILFVLTLGAFVLDEEPGKRRGCAGGMLQLRKLGEGVGRLRGFALLLFFRFGRNC